MTRKALGRGLSALLSPEQQAPAEESSLVDITLIDPNPMQPRLDFADGALRQLADSIIANGVVQPLLVRRKGRRYELIAGERRLRAASLAGLEKVPVAIRDVADDNLLELALIENIQREELNPIEEANAYKKLIETIGMTQEVLAQRVGRDRTFITNYLRLLRLPSDIQEHVRKGELSTGHARCLINLDSTEKQRQAAAKILEKGMSVRETEKWVKRLAAGASDSKSGRLPVEDPNLRAAEDKLRRRLGTRVRIAQDASTLKGKIEIDFADGNELNRIYDLLVRSDTSTASTGN